jgi:hypothetical protein
MKAVAKGIITVHSYPALFTVCCWPVPAPIGLMLRSKFPYQVQAVGKVKKRKEKNSSPENHNSKWATAYQAQNPTALATA